MSVALGFTVIIVLLSIGGYIIFLVHHLRRLRMVDSVYPGDPRRLNGRPIMEVATYHETKGEMSRLRASLDRALDIYGRLPATPRGIADVGQELKTETALEDSSQSAAVRLDSNNGGTIPELSAAVLDLKRSAEALLAAVERRPLAQRVKNAADVDGVGCADDLPGEAQPAYLGTAGIKRIGESLSTINPSIAACYIAMSEAEESSIVEQVSFHVRLMINHIDQALQVLSKA